MRVGEIYGKWNVIEQGHDSGHVVCKCACGVIREVRTDHLKDGRSKSCGCSNVPVSYGTKSVDAIPVEWLEVHKTEYLDDWGEEPITVEEALKMWQKEQEAR